MFNNNLIKILIGRERDIDIEFAAAKHSDSVVRILRGARCSTVQYLFQEFAAALQFPYYFGSNWAAFDECLRDLEWLPGNEYVVVVTNANLALHDEQDFKKFMDVVISITAEGVGNSDKKKLTTVMHVEKAEEVPLLNRLTAHGVSPVVVPLKEFDSVR